MHMNMKVMKFGGTSLRSEATRKYVYRHVLESSKTNKVIVVVSVNELRQFVQIAFTQEVAELGLAGIILGSLQ